MSVLADASTIFLALITRRTTRIAGAYTLDLARYELGNATLRQLRIHRTLSEEEAEELASAISQTILNMTVLAVEDEASVLRLAASADLTFYDASYLYTADRLRLPLATEDARLLRAAKELGVQAMGLTEIREA